jgi:hypothetical protein
VPLILLINKVSAAQDTRIGRGVPGRTGDGRDADRQRLSGRVAIRRRASPKTWANG